MVKLLCFVSICACAVHALDTKFAEMGGAFGNPMLVSDIGAGAQALGNATVALAGNNANPYTNPAAMSFVIARKLQAGGSLLSLSRGEGYAAFTHPIKPRGTFGVTWFYRGDRDIPLFDDVSEQVYGTGSESMNAFYIGAAYRLFRECAVGISTNFYYHTIRYDNSSHINVSNVGRMDIGVLKTFGTRFSLGADLKNIALLSDTVDWQIPTDIMLDAVKPISIPYELKLGGTYRNTYKAHAYLISIEEDVFLWRGNGETGDGNFIFGAHAEHLGAEVWIHDRVSIRTGFDDGRFPLGVSIKDIIKGMMLNYCISLERNFMGFNNNLEMIWEF